MSSHSTTAKFESAVLEHLDAGYNLARWLVGNDSDAQDVVQEACLRAMRGYESFRGGDFRAWFLTIVRNMSFTWLRRNKDLQSMEMAAEVAADACVYDPAEITLRAADAELVRRAIDALPVVLRETVVLREMEGMSYKEIGKIAGVPIGTVMSRLARGRTQLQAILLEMDQAQPRKSGQEGAR